MTRWFYPSMMLGFFVIGFASRPLFDAYKTPPIKSESLVVVSPGAEELEKHGVRFCGPCDCGTPNAVPKK